MRYHLYWFLLAAGLMVPGVAAAKNLIELRVGGFINSGSPDDLNRELESINLETTQLAGYNLDIYLKIPATSFGAGLRYERSSQEVKTDVGGDGVQLEIKDLSLLLGWRVLESQFFHVGPLLTIGVPWGEIEMKDSGEVNLADVDADQLSFGIGVEGGVFFGRFLVGAEVGYKSMKLERAHWFQLVPTLDMSGFYGRLQVGVGLF